MTKMNNISLILNSNIFFWIWNFKFEKKGNKPGFCLFWWKYWIALWRGCIMIKSWNWERKSQTNKFQEPPSLLPHVHWRCLWNIYTWWKNFEKSEISVEFFSLSSWIKLSSGKILIILTSSSSSSSSVFS